MTLPDHDPRGPTERPAGRRGDPAENAGRSTGGDTGPDSAGQALPGTLDAALQWARELGLDRLDARWLLAHVLGCSPAWVAAHGPDALAPHDAQTFLELARQRAQDVPLAYLTGRRGFMGLELTVGPDVLVPRPETEELVTWALDCLQGRPQARVLDLGTGSGAIALALKHLMPGLDVTATDASPAALTVAQANAQSLGLPVRFLSGRWWQALASEPPAARRFDLIVSNPPYIADGDAHLPALRHEPRQALVAGADGLADLRQIIAGAPTHLAPGAWLLLEHGYDQAPAVCELLRACGASQVQSRADLGGWLRCSGGCWPGSKP